MRPAFDVPPLKGALVRPEALSTDHTADLARAAEADWRQLGPMAADLLAVNPPQRPTALMPDVPHDQRHLHDGGGADGLDGIRLVLAHTTATRVRTTAAAPLGMGARRFDGWSAPRSIAGGAASVRGGMAGARAWAAWARRRMGAPQGAVNGWAGRPAGVRLTCSRAAAYRRMCSRLAACRVDRDTGIPE